MKFVTITSFLLLTLAVGTLTVKTDPLTDKLDESKATISLTEKLKEIKADKLAESKINNVLTDKLKELKADKLAESKINNVLTDKLKELKADKLAESKINNVLTDKLIELKADKLAESKINNDKLKNLKAEKLAESKINNVLTDKFKELKADKLADSKINNDILKDFKADTKINNSLSEKLKELKLKLKKPLKKKYSNRLPPFLKICSRNDPNLNECIRRSIENLREHLANGIPQLGLPPCEPLIIPELVMNQGSGAVNVQSVYRNISIAGPSQYVVDAVRADLDKKRIRVSIHLPRLQLNADYSINGRILMLPIAGAGQSEGNYTDINATLILQAESFFKGDKEYLNIVQVFTDFTIGHASLYLSGLFDGDAELGRAMNEFLNENWRNVAAEMRPVLEETIGDLFRRYANSICHK